MNLLPYVNTDMGTKSVRRRSHGNTLPLCQMPFGMSSYTLQTDSDGLRKHWFYYPDHEYAEGVRLIHQPSVWAGDCATVLMMPQSDKMADDPQLAYSGLDRSDKIITPDYISIKYMRTNCLFELTPTERGAAIRLLFFDDRQSFFSFFPVKGNYTYRFDKETNTLFGTNDAHVASDTPVNLCLHFAVKFEDGSIDADKTYIGNESDSEKICIHLALTKKKLEARMGISFISEKLALEAIERECGTLSFEEVHERAREAWEEKLHRIEIEADDKTVRTFYSCLYRVFLFPKKMYEYDGDKIVHYCPTDGTVRDGVRYGSTGFWDTARTQFPLFTLIARDEYAEMLEGFVNDYLEGGWLPRWPVIGEMGAMPSTFIDCVIADAAVRGIGKREVLENAFCGMLHHANTPCEDGRYGRNAVDSYIKHGYVPFDKRFESVNLTLDGAYCDWCIATVAKALGHDEYVDEYMKRSNNYKNLYDPETGFMRARDSAGNFKTGFDLVAWGSEYCEGGAWQTSFFVPHDIEGLAELHGGKDKLIKKLDEMLASEPRYRVVHHQREIHEMTEMGLADFGQCAISNQPCFHIPFLFAALGAPEKTNALVERILTELFEPTTEGFPGDEDNGSMGAWYILATLGMYPICPGSTDWVYCKRSVKSAKIMGKEI